jgi:hypothetical protein
MTDVLEIPAYAFDVKDWFKERPSKDVATEILEFIQSKGTPHLWRGHTHNAPPKGANVTFLGRYSLPPSHCTPSRAAPCPCCSPRSPKYFRCGLIAWFADEGVIRNVGDQCYKRMDPAGYELAMERFNHEVEVEREFDYLGKMVPKIPGILNLLTKNVAPLAAIDELCQTLTHTVINRLNMDLWGVISDGSLKTVKVEVVDLKDKRGIAQPHGFGEYVGFALLPGHIAFRPKPHRLRDEMNKAIHAIRQFDFGVEGPAHLLTKPDLERSILFRNMQSAFKAADKIVAQAEEIRRFFTPEQIGTFNRWSRHSDAPYHLFVGMTAAAFQIGKLGVDPFSIHWPKDFWTTLRPLPQLSEMAA